MAFGASKDAVFKLDNVAGTLTDLSAYLTGVSLSQSGAIFDVTPLGRTWRDKLRGMDDLEITLSGIYDPAPGSILFNLGTATASSSWEFYPQGTASGKQKYSGEAYVTAFSPPANLDEGITFSATLGNSGTVTLALV